MANIASFAERLRARIAELNFGAPLSGRSVTLSLGVAVRQQRELLLDFIQRADTALYDAKNAGRNRVCFADDSIAPIRPPALTRQRFNAWSRLLAGDPAPTCPPCVCAPDCWRKSALFRRAASVGSRDASPVGGGDHRPSVGQFRHALFGAGTRYGQMLYLHTSPEFPMKRLLAAGSGCIYQIARVFRDGEAGRRHNPEFSLLEWYRLGFDHHRLMSEVAELVTALLAGRMALAEPERLSYRELFQRFLGLDPIARVRELAACARSHLIPIPPGMPAAELDPWLDLLLTHRIEPELGQGRLSFVYDYPVSQAALARLRPGDPPVGERFELYLHGVELANGFHELGMPPNSAAASSGKTRNARRWGYRRCRSTSTCWRRWTAVCQSARAWRSVSIAW